MPIGRGMSDSPKATLSWAAGKVVAAGGRLTYGLRAHFVHEGERIRKIGEAVDTLDEAGARGIASVPAMRELLAHNEKRAIQLLRIGLNGHYGRPGADGTRLYLDIGPSGIHWDDDHISRKLHFGGTVYHHQGGHSVGRVAMTFMETKQGTLVVNADLVRLDEHTRGRWFTGHLMLGLRDYFRRSGVDHVKVTAGLTHGGRGWAGIFDWDPDKVDLNRQSMTFRIDMVYPEVHLADRAKLLKLQEAFDGPPELWPSPREVLGLHGRSHYLGEQVLQDSEWHGKFKL